MESELTTNTLYPVIPYAWKLHKITEKIRNELDLPVEGESIRKKFGAETGIYGHIKLRILLDENAELFSSCSWQVSSDKIPIEFRTNVEKVLSFFIAYLKALKGNEIKVRFEIIDGSFHPVDSDGWAYEYVTLEAIVNAFDKSVYGFDLSKLYKGPIK